MEGANLYDYMKNLCLIWFYLSGLEKQDPANITISVLIILTSTVYYTHGKNYLCISWKKISSVQIRTCTIYNTH